MRKFILGAIIGIALTAVIMFGYRTIFLKDYACMPTQYAHLKDSLTNNSILLQNVNDLKYEHATFVEKISSTNKRIDDILVFGGIIVTLILGVIVGVYLRAESEVEHYFKENFEQYRNRIIELETSASNYVSAARSSAEVIDRIRQNMGAAPDIPTNPHR